VIRRPERRWILAPVMVLALTATSTAFGDDSRDQVNDVVSTGSVDCGGYGRSLFQAFVPSRRLLASVDLWFRAGQAFPAAGTTLQIAVQTEVAPTRKPRAEATAFVPGPAAYMETRLVHFEFQPPAVLEPEGPFLVEWVTVPGWIMSWFLRTDDPYANGTAISCLSQPMPKFDFNFVTWTPPDAAPPTTTISGSPARRTRSRTASFAFAASDDLSFASKLVFRCHIDRRPWAPCTSPFRVRGLRKGPHTFSVGATDQAGTADPTPAIHRWQVVVP
jgi:hypothetical protein